MVSPPIDVSRIPDVIPNLVGGKDAAAADGRRFAKLDPATGREICQVARSGATTSVPRWRARKPPSRPGPKPRRCVAATSCARSQC